MSIAELADEYFAALLAHQPLRATVRGYHDHDGEVGSVSVESEAAWRSELVSIRDRSREQPASVVRDVLIGEVDRIVDAIDDRLTEFAYDSVGGLHTRVFEATAVTAYPEPDHAEAAVGRYHALARFFDEAVERFRAGAASGWVSAESCIDRSLSQLDSYLASPVGEDLFVEVGAPEGWEGEPAWRERLAEAVVTSVRPALQRYREVLAAELRPVARSDDRPGLCWLDRGPETYARLVGHMTTTTLTPEEIHAIGRAEIEDRLAAEYAELGQTVFGLSDPWEVIARLRTDPDLKFADHDEAVAAATAAIDRAAAAMGDWFGVLPKSSCVVRTVPEFLAAGAPPAYYEPPLADGSRPGAYFINPRDPEEQNRYEAEDVAFHEAIPGHHLQLTLAVENEALPDFQRANIGLTVFIEGWALYAERLADEMGLFSTDLDRIGMLVGDSFRSARLVVDTGLHALGWTRQQAVEFMTETVPLPAGDIEAEVDRYIGWPAQALAYKIGQREISRIRREAEARLGPDFDIKGFHDVVLGSGALTLPLLEDMVAAWQPSQRT